MGLFSIWHWLIVLIMFSPIILGVLLMGLQKKILLKHAQSNIVKNGYIGYSWTYLFFGWMVPIFRGEIGIGVLHLVITLVSLGIFQLIMPFLYNKQFMTRQLINGWELNDNEQRNELARRKLNIAM